MLDPSVIDNLYFENAALENSGGNKCDQ